MHDMILDPASGAQVGNPIPIGLGYGGSMLVMTGLIFGRAARVDLFQASNMAPVFKHEMGTVTFCLLLRRQHMWVQTKTRSQSSVAREPVPVFTGRDACVRGE